MVSLGASSIVDIHEATANENQAHGFTLHLQSLVDSHATLDSVEASDNGANGILLNLNSTNSPSDSILFITNSIAINNVVWDVEATAESDSGDAFITLGHVDLNSGYLAVSSISGASGIIVTP